jgi:hypothetical protein
LIACFLIGYHIRRRNTKEKMAALWCSTSMKGWSARGPVYSKIECN